MRHTALGLLAAGLLAAGVVHAQPSPSPGRPGVQVLRADDLARAGLVRLSDLFALLDGWYALSTDGFSWRASAGGLAPAHTARWQLYVDGHRVDATVLDVQNLNLVPLHPAQLDSVVVHHVPTVIDGRLAGAGVIHLYPHRPDGLAARAGMMLGNEIDDPGPYAFTDPDARNVDRVGPGYVASLGYGTATAGVEATYRQDYQHVTRRPLWDRVFGVYGRPHPLNRVMQQSLGVQAYATGSRSRHRLQVGYTRFRDYRFLDPLGFEIATDHRTPFAGGHGTLALGRATTLSYRVGYRRERLGEWKNRVDHTFDWAEDRGHASVALRYRRGRLTSTSTLGLDRRVVRTGRASFGTARLHTGHLAQEVEVRQPSGLLLRGAVVGLLQAREAGLEALAVAHVPVAARRQVRLTVSHSDRPAADPDRLGYWLYRGYQVPWAERTAITPAPSLSRPRTTTLDLTGSYAPGGGWLIEAGPAWRSFAGGLDAVYTFGFVDPDDIFRGRALGTAVYRSHLRGQVWRGHVAVTHRTAVWRRHLAYAWQRHTGADAAAAAGWAGQPEHLLRVHIGYDPVPRFSLNARLQVQSATAWPGYAAADAATDGVYPDRLPPYALLDLSAWKAFGGGVLEVMLLLRNVLNAPYRTHPAAPETRLTFFVKAQLRL